MKLPDLSFDKLDFDIPKRNLFIFYNENICYNRYNHLWFEYSIEKKEKY
ncbi:MAG TPA: hypothetical protein VLB84_00800 [Bacteroidia bacterium]|nr:hypothetical protein [Bacteroidia bacterium]